MSDDSPALVSRDELAVLVKHAGLSPPPSQFEELFNAYQHVKAMTDRLKRDFAFHDEPAHIYCPQRF